MCTTSTQFHNKWLPCALAFLVVGAFGASESARAEGATFGGFDSAVPYAVGQDPHAVEAADLDGDGDLDLIIVDWADDAVSVLLNLGDGTFAPAQSYPVGDEPFRVAVADLDGDGDLDLAVANSRDPAMSILKNNGDGTFAPQQVIPLPGQPLAVAAGDLDGDGDNDLVYANFFGPPPYGIRSLLNLGDATFTQPDTLLMTFSGLTPVLGMEIVDVDADGSNDIAAALVAWHEVHILLNKGGGGFGESDSYPVNAQTPFGLTTADLDGDNDLDIAVVSNVSGVVVVLSNLGNGQFTVQEQTFAVGPDPEGIDSADVDGDGDIDIVVANQDSNTISVLLNQGDGTFAPQQTYPVAGVNVDLTVGDFDGNGTPDVAILNHDDDTVEVLINLTTVPPPGPFELLAPDADTVALSPLTPTLAWSEPTGFPASYTVRIARDEAFTDLVLDQSGVTAQTLEVPPGVLENSTQYYWQVIANSSGGDTPAVNGPLAFTTHIPGDVNFDGAVGATDLLILLSNWGGPQ